MEEIFKTIPSFPDYQVSNFGRVKTNSRPIRYIHAKTKNEHFRITEEKFLKVHYNNRTGYKFYQLYLNKKMYNKTIHSLVSDAFLNSVEEYECINHIDGNKHNNCVSNLERCTNKYNHEHAVKTGLSARGDRVKNSKLNDNCVYAIRYFIEKGYSDLELSRAFKISRPTINLIRNNKLWKHVPLTGEELTIKN